MVTLAPNRPINPDSITEMKTLQNTYCKPTREAEWDLLPDRDLWCRNEGAVFGAIDFSKQKVGGMTEISVQHFIDLLEDRIVPWRIEELAFKELAKGVWSWSDDGHQILISFEPELNVMLAYSDQGMIPVDGIQKFTDLLTIIRFLK